MTRVNSHRFVVLDGLRGIAALVVLGFHLVQQRDTIGPFPWAYLAVDFFYLLSGFVVAFAYEQRLQNGSMGFGTFSQVRVARLYPLVFLGTGAGIVLAAVAVITKGTVTYQGVAFAGVLGLLLLPSYVFPQWTTAYPFNMASWSLTFELFINAVYGLIAPRLTSARLIGLVAFSSVVLIGSALINDGVTGGYDQNNFAWGFGRVMFPFFAGVLLYRYRVPQRMAPWTGFGTLVGLAVLLLFPLRGDGLVSLLYVLVLFPAIIATGAAIAVGPALTRTCQLAGALSYPIYILQGPMLRLGDEILRHLHLSLVQACLFGAVEAGIITMVAYAALKLFDEPLQRYFKARIGRRHVTREPVRGSSPSASPPTTVSDHLLVSRTHSRHFHR